MRRSEHPLAPLLDLELPVQAQHGGRVKGFFDRQRRQQPGETLGQHGFAGARRPHQKQAVRTGRSDLHRALGARLALDVAQIRQHADGLWPQWRSLRDRDGRTGAAFDQPANHVEQVRGGVHRDAIDQCRLLGACQRQDQRALDLHLAHAQRQCQSAAHRAQLTRQRKFTGEFELLQAGCVDLTAGRQDAQRDGQVEAAGLLGQFGRRKVHRDALVVGKGEAAVLQCCPYPFPGFLHLGVR